MKMVLDDARTSSAFERNARGKTVVAAFFFHDRGSDLQKSLEGLLRDVLWKISKEVPSLGHLFLNSYEQKDSLVRDSGSTPWTRSTTLPIFRAMMAQDIIEVSVLLFIDALDEYSGHHKDIAMFLESCKGAKKTKLKICFSSRPEQEFLDRFADTPGFYIHEQTEDDIRKVIETEFDNNTRMKGFLVGADHQETTAVVELQNRILELSNGVFLWTRLILDELLDEYTGGATLEELRVLLEKVPGDLEDYYDYMVANRISKDERHVVERRRIFQILQCGDVTSLRELFLAVELATVRDLSTYKATLPSDLDHARRRLKRRCGPLVEDNHRFPAPKGSVMVEDPLRDKHELDIGDCDPSLIRNRPQFLHQTVKTWSSKSPGISVEGNGYEYLLKAAVHTARCNRGLWPGHINVLTARILGANAAGSDTLWIPSCINVIKIASLDWGGDYDVSVLAALAGVPSLLKKALKTTEAHTPVTFKQYCRWIADYNFRKVDVHWDAEIPSTIMDHELISESLPYWTAATFDDIGILDSSLRGNDAVYHSRRRVAIPAAAGGWILMEEVIASLVAMALRKTSLKVEHGGYPLLFLNLIKDFEVVASFNENDGQLSISQARSLLDARTHLGKWNVGGTIMGSRTHAHFPSLLALPAPSNPYVSGGPSSQKGLKRTEGFYNFPKQATKEG